MTRRLTFLLAAAAPVAVTAQSPTSHPTAENLEARRWFQDAKLGLFIHWGPSATLADGEWVMENHGITAADYERVPGGFNPVDFDPAAWVSLAKAAGMKYLTLITKHHDGIALFDSKLTDWNVVARTPYKRDIVRMLADECRRQGIKLFFYYSQLDWHHPDYAPIGETGHKAGRPTGGEWNRYLDFMDGQLTELLTNYGPVGGIWFDGMWDKPAAAWRLGQTYGLIHRLQPAALVGSNHHRRPNPGEDFQMFEKDLPGANTAGFNTTEVSPLPLETAETMNDSWGFRITDRNYKSVDHLVRELVQAAGRNANFLLNVGPMPNGQLPPDAVARLQGLGAWISRYGTAIYGTRGGPIPPRPWGVTTAAGDRVYLHLLDWEDPTLAIPALDRPVLKASRLVDGTPVPVRTNGQSLILSLPPRAPETVDEVVVLDLGRPPGSR